MSRISKIDETEFAQLWNANTNAEDMAKRFSCTTKSLYNRANWLRRSKGMKLRLRNHQQKISDTVFLREWNGPKTLAKIADEYGMTQMGLSTRATKLRKEGVKLRERPTGMKVGTKIGAPKASIPVVSGDLWRVDLMQRLKVRIAKLVACDRMGEAQTAMSMLAQIEGKTPVVVVAPTKRKKASK